MRLSVPLTGNAEKGRVGTAPPSEADFDEPEKDLRGVAMPDILREREPSGLDPDLPRDRPGVAGSEVDERASTSECEECW